MLLARVSVRNPVMVTMCVLVVIVLGLFFARTLNIEQFPQVDIPFVIITTDYPGASPSTVELSLTKPLEESLNQIEGLEHLSSRSSYGRSVITLQFFLGQNIQRIMEDVRERLSLARSRLQIQNLPDSRLTRYDPSSVPVAQLSLSSDKHSIAELTQLATFQVVRRLVSLPGIAQLNVVGGEMPQVKILIHPERLASLGIGVDQLLKSILEKNRTYPLGQIESRDELLSLEMHSPYRTMSDFSNMVIAHRGDELITLGEVADVRFVPAEPESISLLNGRRVLSINVLLQSGSNLVSVVHDLQRAIPGVQSLLPADAHLSLVRDSSSSITSSLQNFNNIIREGVVLTVLIVFVFLGSWRSMVITAISLPVSLLAAFIVLYLCGYSINFLTLMALSLCVGLLIDDSIVVRENVVRHLRMGKSSRDAALEGTAEIGFAVFATTITTVVVFLPISGMSGIVGLYFRPFALTVVFVVLVSMIVSFTVDPMLSAIWSDPLPVPGRPLSWTQRFSQAVHAIEERIVTRYAALLFWALRRRAIVVLVAVLIFIGSIFTIPHLGSEFVPVTDYGEIMANLHLPPSSSLHLTTEKMTEVSIRLRDAFPSIDRVLVAVNGRQNNTKNVGNVYIILKPLGAGRHLSLQALLPKIRAVLEEIAGIDIRYLGSSRQGGRDDGGQNPLSFYLTGSSVATLEALTDKIMTALKTVPGLGDVQSSLDDTVPGILLHLNEDQAARRGISASQISSTLNAVLAQQVLSSWEGPDGEVYDLITALPQMYTSTKFLDDLFLASDTASSTAPALVPMRDFVSMQKTDLPRDIQHYHLLRAVQISGASIGHRPVGDVLRDIRAVLAKQSLPAGYSVVFQGQASDMAEAFHSFVIAILFSLFLIYAVLASQFKSFWDPFVIMMVLPLSFSGSIFGLAVGGQHLNIFSFVGLLVMFGLSTKNSILLIDVVKNALLAGESRLDALIRAGRTRFRPIMMTSLAMVAGMLPQLFPGTMGFETRQPMAYAVIGGVVVSTLLSLVLIPVVYTGFDDFRAWFSGLLSRKRSLES